MIKYYDNKHFIGKKEKNYYFLALEETQSPSKNYIKTLSEMDRHKEYQMF